MPSTLRKYQALQKAKKAYCAGRTTKAKVAAVSRVYIAAAVAGGQTKTEATAKANKVLRGACKMTARIAGKKRKSATGTTKRKTTHRSGSGGARRRAAR